MYPLRLSLRAKSWGLYWIFSLITARHENWLKFLLENTVIFCNFLFKWKSTIAERNKLYIFRRFSTYRGAKREGDSYLNNSNEFKLNPPSKNELIHDWYASIFIRMSKSHFNRAKSVEIKTHKFSCNTVSCLKVLRDFQVNINILMCHFVCDEKCSLKTTIPHHTNSVGTFTNSTKRC